MGQMLVNLPYMEHMGYGLTRKKKGGHFMGFNHIDPSEIGGDAV